MMGLIEMDEIKEYTVQLSAALRGSEAYKAFREVSKKVSEEPQLRQRLDEFRKKELSASEWKQCLRSV